LEQLPYICEICGEAVLLEKRGSLSTETVALRIIDIVSIDAYPRRRASNEEPL